MQTKQQLEKIIIESLLEILPSTHGANKAEVDIYSETFYGENGLLDSMALVSFIVVLEEKLQNIFNVDAILANEKALSSHNSPFKNLNSLTSYIETHFLHEATHG